MIQLSLTLHSNSWSTCMFGTQMCFQYKLLLYCIVFRVPRGHALVHSDVCEHSPDPSVESETTEADGDGQSAPTE